MEHTLCYLIGSLVYGTNGSIIFLMVMVMTQLSPGIVDGGKMNNFKTCGQGIYYTGQLLIENL